MKLSTTYSFWQAAAATVLLALSGCSSDVPGELPGVADGAPTEVSFSISARRNAETRADGTPETPTADGEKICDWFAVFVDKSNTVRKILHRSDAETLVAQTDAAVEEERFKCILPSGTYTIYAFANMTEDELKSTTGLTFIKDEDAPDKIDEKTWTPTLNLLDIGTKKIPMSGCLKEVKIENVIEESFSIKVVRMAAKVELVFTNPDDKAVTVSSIGIDPVTTSAISLFPRSTTGSVTGISYSHLGNSAYAPLEGATYGKVTYTPSDAINVTKSDPRNAVFYIQESISDYKNDGSFTITLNVRHEDGVAETEQHNITSSIRRYINRNDWIRIPVTLSRYDINVEALFYPPIGGYPSYLSATDPEGAQVFTFGTEGDFAIVPHAVDKVSGRHLTSDCYEISVMTGSISDPDGIFKTQPAKTSGLPGLPDEILGALNSNQGKASLKVQVDVYASPRVEGAVPINSYIRTIYIIRDNNITNTQD